MTVLAAPGLEVDTLRRVTPPSRYLSVGDLARRWGLTNPGVHARLKRFGLLTDDRRMKGGYVFTREEIHALEERESLDVVEPGEAP